MNNRKPQLYATYDQWFTKNPFLLKGEIGYEVVYGENQIFTSIKVKIGDDRRWNDTPYQGGGVFSQNAIVNNPIGLHKLGDQLNGQGYDDILRKLLTQYSTPSLNSFTDNISNTYEIGTSISGSINLTWTFSNASNLKVNSGLLTQSESVITIPSSINPISGSPLTVNIINPFTKIVPGSFSLSFSAKHIGDNGTSSINTNSRSISFSWLSRIRWGALPTSILNNQEQATSLINSELRSNINRDYTFYGGYAYVLIPRFFESQVNNAITQKKFMQLLNGVPAFEYAIDFLDVYEPSASRYLTYDNGNIEFEYIILRSENSLGGSTQLRII